MLMLLLLLPRAADMPANATGPATALARRARSESSGRGSDALRAPAAQAHAESRGRAVTKGQQSIISACMRGKWQS